MDEKRKDALRKWYSQDWVIQALNKKKEEENWDDFEAQVQRFILLPLGKHDKLPDFMRDDDGKTLFPTNLNPLHDEEGWQDAIEVGWDVVKEKLSVSMEEVQAKIRSEIDEDWERFMKSVEERKKGKSSPEK